MAASSIATSKGSWSRQVIRLAPVKVANPYGARRSQMRFGLLSRYALHVFPAFYHFHTPSTPVLVVCLSPFSSISAPGASLATVTRRHRYIRINAAVRLSPSLTALFRYRIRDQIHTSVHIATGFLSYLEFTPSDHTQPIGVLASNMAVELSLVPNYVFTLLLSELGIHEDAHI